MVQKMWAACWKSSTQKRKQRKFIFNAPLHIKHKLCSSRLSKSLQEQYGTRSIPIRKQDTVKIMTGQFKDKSGKVSRVFLSKMKVYIDGIGIKRTDDSLALYPFSASNLMITKLDLTDKLRVQKLEERKNGRQENLSGENQAKK